MIDRRLLGVLGLAMPLFTGCLGGGGEAYDGDDGVADADADIDADSDSDSDTEPVRLAPELGLGDHTPESVSIVVAVNDPSLREPTGIAFAGDSPGDLWIVDRYTDGWTIVDDIGTPSEVVRSYLDDSQHFLNQPSALSFSTEESIVATCLENGNDYNGLQLPDLFMGPVAWTTDRDMFSGGGMSHYDMAHETPYCMGIAWSEDHVFWAFNGHDSAIDRINFHDWHPDGPNGDGLGGDDHLDGVYFRYVPGQVRRVENVPSHMVHNPQDGYLYVNDTGNSRVVRLDATPKDGQLMTGRIGEMPMYECEGDLEMVVAAGDLDQPSGMALYNDILYITDHGTGEIHAYTLEGEELNWVDTGLGGGHLTGIAVSSEGVVYFADMVDDLIYRIDVPAPTE